MGVVNVIIARTYFQSTIPAELYETAGLDGASDTQVLLRIVAPLSKPIIAVLILYYAVGHWNSFFSAMIYLDSPRLYPLQVILRDHLLQESLSMEEHWDPNAAIYMAKQEVFKYGLIVVDLSTIKYLPTLDIARRLQERGVHFADAPVSGMEARAKEAQLTVMFGGEEAIFEQVRPVFDAIGNKVIYMGEIGSGQLTKLTNQLLFNISCAAIAEVLPMAVKLGLDPEKITQVVTTGTGRSFAAEFFLPLALEGRFDQGYPLKEAYKDMISAAEICAYSKIPLPLVHSTTTTYQMALNDGYGDESKGAMIKVFERILGVKFRKKGGA